MLFGHMRPAAEHPPRSRVDAGAPGRDVPRHAPPPPGPARDLGAVLQLRPARLSGAARGGDAPRRRPRCAWAALGLLLVAALGAPAAAAEPGLLVTVGEVTDTSAVIWVRGVACGRGHRALRADRPRAGRRGRGAPRAPAAHPVEPSRHLTGKLLLRAARARHPLPLHRGPETRPRSRGEFVTAPAPGRRAAGALRLERRSRRPRPLPPTGRRVPRSSAPSRRPARRLLPVRRRHDLRRPRLRRARRACPATTSWRGASPTSGPSTATIARTRRCRPTSARRVGVRDLGRPRGPRTTSPGPPSR